MDRRNFLRHSALASTACLVPQFLQSYAPDAIMSSRSRKALVVIQLSGGNDGLNTVVPFRNDLYYRNRPTLGIPPEEVIPLDDEQGFHPALAALRSGYERGQMAILHAVGYPNPDRSHFRSMDIWQTGSGSDEYLSTGWLGRYLDHHCVGCAPHAALELDDDLGLALKGAESKGFAVGQPDRLRRAALNPLLRRISESRPGSGEAKPAHDNVAYLYKTLVDTQSSAAYLSEKSKGYASRANYPDSRFARQLQMVAQLLTTDRDIHLFYLNHGGFDTHARQLLVQERLLRQYAEGLAAFLDDLQRHRLLDEVIVLTFSEFGRRVAENASRGTDHGAANVVFLHGGKLRRPGCFNAGPDLSRLVQGDIPHAIDFRSVYADLLRGVLDANPQEVLGRQFDRLGIV